MIEFWNVVIALIVGLIGEAAIHSRSSTARKERSSRGNPIIKRGKMLHEKDPYQAD